MNKCKPSTWAVIGAGDNITYGFRCAVHGIATRRYATRELRDQRMREHRQSAKKGAKKN